MDLRDTLEVKPAGLLNMANRFGDMVKPDMTLTLLPFGCWGHLLRLGETRRDLGEKNHCFHFGHVKFEMQMSHQSKKAVGI